MRCTLGVKSDAGELHGEGVAVLGNELQDELGVRVGLVFPSFFPSFLPSFNAAAHAISISSGKKALSSIAPCA